MAATYTRERKAQSPTGVQSCAFSKGDTVGHLIVMVDAKWRTQRLKCKCSTTGKTIIISPHTLRNHRYGVSRTCPACNKRQKVWRKPDELDSAGKFCRICYGMPHRRPISKRCACGEKWEPETIAIDLNDRNPGNLSSAIVTAYEVFA